MPRRANTRWIRIQEADKSPTDFDSTPATWVDKYELRAKIMPTSSNEVSGGFRQESQYSHQVEFRWQPDVKAGQRILIDDETIPSDTDKRVLHIGEVVDVGDYQTDLILNCTERP
jgi:head-tail adaptor